MVTIFFFNRVYLTFSSTQFGFVSPEIQSPFMIFHSVNLTQQSFTCSLEIGIDYSIRVLIVLVYVLFEYLALVYELLEYLYIYDLPKKPLAINLLIIHNTCAQLAEHWVYLGGK